MSINSAEPFALKTWTLGALPLLQYVLDKLEMDALLGEYVAPRTQRVRLPPAVALGVLLRNIVGRIHVFRVKPTRVKAWNFPYVSTSSSARPCSRREA